VSRESRCDASVSPVAGPYIVQSAMHNTASAGGGVGQHADDVLVPMWMIPNI
jgi:hypothetical protein